MDPADRILGMKKMNMGGMMLWPGRKKGTSQNSPQKAHTARYDPKPSGPGLSAGPAPYQPKYPLPRTAAAASKIEGIPNMQKRPLMYHNDIINQLSEFESQESRLIELPDESPGIVERFTPVTLDQKLGLPSSSQSVNQALNKLTEKLRKRPPERDPAERPVSRDREVPMNRDTERPVNIERERLVSRDMERPLSRERERFGSRDGEVPMNRNRERLVNIERDPAERPVSRDREVPLNRDRERPLSIERERLVSRDMERLTSRERDGHWSRDREIPLSIERERPMSIEREGLVSRERERLGSGERDVHWSRNRERPLSIERERPSSRERERLDSRERDGHWSRERERYPVWERDGDTMMRCSSRERERSPSHRRERQSSALQEEHMKSLTFCDICDVQCGTLRVYLEHRLSVSHKGKESCLSHRLKMKCLQEHYENLKELIPNRIQTRVAKTLGKDRSTFHDIQYYCMLCDVWCGDERRWNDHLYGHSHPQRFRHTENTVYFGMLEKEIFDERDEQEAFLQDSRPNKAPAPVFPLEPPYDPDDPPVEIIEIDSISESEERITQISSAPPPGSMELSSPVKGTPSSERKRKAASPESLEKHPKWLKKDTQLSSSREDETRTESEWQEMAYQVLKDALMETRSTVLCGWSKPTQKKVSDLEKKLAARIKDNTGLKDDQAIIRAMELISNMSSYATLKITQILLCNLTPETSSKIEGLIHFFGQIQAVEMEDPRLESSSHTQREQRLKAIEMGDIAAMDSIEPWVIDAVHKKDLEKVVDVDRPLLAVLKEMNPSVLAKAWQRYCIGTTTGIGAGMQNKRKESHPPMEASEFEGKNRIPEDIDGIEMKSDPVLEVRTKTWSSTFTEVTTSTSKADENRAKHEEYVEKLESLAKLCAMERKEKLKRKVSSEENKSVPVAAPYCSDNNSVTIAGSQSHGVVAKVNLLQWAVPRPQKPQNTGTAFPQPHGTVTTLLQPHGTPTALLKPHGATTLQQSHGTVTKLQQPHGTATTLQWPHRTATKLQQPHGSVTTLQQTHSTVTKLQHIPPKVTALQKQQGTVNALQKSQSTVPQPHGMVSALQQQCSTVTALQQQQQQQHGVKKLPQLGGTDKTLQERHGVPTKLGKPPVDGQKVHSKGNSCPSTATSAQPSQTGKTKQTSEDIGGRPTLAPASVDKMSESSASTNSAIGKPNPKYTALQQLINHNVKAYLLIDPMVFEKMYVQVPQEDMLKEGYDPELIQMLYSLPRNTIEAATGMFRLKKQFSASFDHELEDQTLFRIMLGKNKKSGKFKRTELTERKIQEAGRWREHMLTTQQLLEAQTVQGGQEKPQRVDLQDSERTWEVIQKEAHHWRMHLKKTWMGDPNMPLLNVRTEVLHGIRSNQMSALVKLQQWMLHAALAVHNKEYIDPRLKHLNQNLLEALSHVPPDHLRRAIETKR